VRCLHADQLDHGVCVVKCERECGRGHERGRCGREQEREHERERDDQQPAVHVTKQRRVQACARA